MNTKLATTLVIGALLAPVAGYAAGKSMTQIVEEAVADSVIAPLSPALRGGEP